MFEGAQQPFAAEFLRQIADDLSREDLRCPTFIDASLGVRMALKQNQLSGAELTRIVEGEPLLSARVVALANSAALHRSGRTITDVKSAVVLVGQKAVSNIALSLALQQVTHSKELAPFRAQAREIWAHSMEVAVLSSVLARHGGSGIAPDEALFAGLVHDLGYFYSMWRAAQHPELTTQPGRLRSVVFDQHAAIGAAMLRSMKLDPQLCLAVAEHEQHPATLPPGRLSQLLSVANRCADQGLPAPDSETPAVAPPALDERQANTLLAEHFDEVTWLLAVMKGA